MITHCFPQSMFARLCLFTCLVLPVPAFADWKDMNADIDATNFIVKAGPVGEPKGLCTGTLISLQYRLVLTANHCLTDNITVEEKEETSDSGVVDKVKREVYTDLQLEQKSYQGFDNVGSATYVAKIVAHNKHTDMGLLQLKSDTIPQTMYSHVLGANGKVTRGDSVFAVGNPRGLDASVTHGIVSSTTRTFKIGEDGDDQKFYQVDAAITFGNSGGALYNDDGELIGVLDATGHDNLGFVTPIEVIHKFLNAACYEDAWNDKAAKSHAQCVADKLKDENDRREKNGLPPLQSGDKAESSGGQTLKALKNMEERPQSSLMQILGY